jgi:hypothetical protein
VGDIIKDFHITLDLVKNVEGNPSIQIKGSDFNSVKFAFTILDNGEVVDLTNTEIRLAIEKPSKLTVFQDCVITNALEGLCELVLTNQGYVEVGNHQGELIITKNDIASTTDSFSFLSVNSILDDETLESQNDWQALHEIMLNAHLRPELGEGSPNGVVMPTYIGQTYLDTLGKSMYFASNLTNNEWLPFGIGGEGGSGIVYWNDVLSKPTTFPSTPHTHVWNDISNPPTTYTPSEHTHDEYLTEAEGDIRYNLKGEGGGGASEPSQWGDITGVLANQTDLQMVLDEKANDTDLTNKADLNHTHTFDSITGKPVSYPPETHSHPINQVTGLQTALDGKADDSDLTNKADSNHTHTYTSITGKPLTFPPDAHNHGWTEITGKPTTFPPETHNHNWVDIQGKPTTFDPTQHTHLWGDITDKPATFTPETHSHQISEVTGLQEELDEKFDKTGGTIDGDFTVDGDAIFKNTPTNSGISFLSTVDRNILQSSNAPLNSFKPLDIMGSEVTINGAVFKSGTVPNGTILWTGNLQMTQAHVITPSQPIDNCQNGWLLKWTGSIGQNVCYVQCYKFAGKGEWTFNAMADVESWATSQTVTKVIMVNAGGTTITGHNDNTSANNAERYLQAVIAF